MWVQLRSIQHIEENGRQMTRHPGDWVNVGKQTALLWIQRGEAVLPEKTKYGDFELASGSGLLIISDEPETPDNPNPNRKPLEPFARQIEISVGARCLPWERNVLWTPSFGLRLELVPVGLMLLETWQIAVPLWDYKQLASQVGSHEDREKTRAVIHDLRVPLYDTRLMFVRACKECELLFNRWEQEMKAGGDERLAFARALYKTPMLILALPMTWTFQDAR